MFRPSIHWRLPVPFTGGAALATVICAICAMGAFCGCDAVVQSRPLPLEAMEQWSTEPEVAEQNSEPTVTWDGWRGGGRAGVAEFTSFRADGKHDLSTCVEWATELPGDGKSSPIVWDDHVYLTMVHDGQLTVCSYRLSDGSLHWQQPLQTAGAPGETHVRNGFASATPATNGELIVVAAPDALHAVDRDGATVWRRALPGTPHHWGAGSSPMIHGSVVFHLSDNGSASQLGCYLLESGEPAWIAKLDSAGGWSSPAFRFDTDGRLTQLIINGTGSRTGQPGCVTSFDPWTGKRQWAVEGTADIPCATAIVGENLVVSSTGKNGPLMAMDLTSGKVAWHSGAGGAQVPTGVAVGARLFLISDHGKLSCRNLATGEVLWSERLGGAFSASLLAAGTRLYATSEDGRVLTAQVDGDQFQRGSVIDLGESCWATPALLPDAILVRTERTLWRLSSPPSESRTSSDSASAE